MKRTLSLFAIAALSVALTPNSDAQTAAPKKKENAIEKAAGTVKKDAEAAAKKVENETVAVKDTAESQVDKALGKPLPYQATVDAVDAEKKLFTSKTKAGKVNTFHITERTQILKGDVVGTIADIKAGETVRGTRYKTGEGDWEAIKVTIGAKPEAAEKKKKEN
jgi:hypothetical protein